MSKAAQERRAREAAAKAAADPLCSPDLKLAALAADAMYNEEKKKELDERLGK